MPNNILITLSTQSQYIMGNKININVGKLLSVCFSLGLSSLGSTHSTIGNSIIEKMIFKLVGHPPRRFPKMHKIAGIQANKYLK